MRASVFARGMGMSRSDEMDIYRSRVHVRVWCAYGLTWRQNSGGEGGGAIGERRERDRFEQKDQGWRWHSKQVSSWVTTTILLTLLTSYYSRLMQPNPSLPSLPSHSRVAESSSRSAAIIGRSQDPQHSDTGIRSRDRTSRER